MPNRETLKTCFINNADGAGFMFRDPDTGTIQGQKGYMKFKKLYLALATLGDVTDLDLVVHFRIGTHGLMDKSATHPFPASTQITDLAATAWVHEMGIAHNGVVQGFGNAKLSDTQEFIQGYLSRMVRAIHLEEIRNLVEDITNGSKWVVMTDEITYRIGQFITHEGCHYSNSDFQRVPIRSYTHYGDWEDPRSSWKQGSLFSQAKTWKQGKPMQVQNTCPMSHQEPRDPVDCMREGCVYFDAQVWECGAGVSMPYWDEM
jgi:hypothetical protein